MFSTVAVATLFATSAVFALPGGGSSTNVATTNIANVPSVNECNYTGGSVCCNSLDFAKGAEQETLLSLLNVPIDFNALVGHGCSPLVGVNAVCNAQAACCEHTYEGIGVSCNNLAL
ncbi:hypothetical protein BDV98DRAFT_588036 [Pterulicium gracile]|uniref:Hydrophobin n=1 Tax=Pterulicium gracile TaxID=1884261 RepID=A0A5C3R820_9AGAR|nr:hypothetical protein BDV98DRAFT_588036 [Pterula gracilis]